MHVTKSKLTASRRYAAVGASRTKRRNRDITERTAALPKILTEMLAGWGSDGPMTAVVPFWAMD